MHHQGCCGRITDMKRRSQPLSASLNHNSAIKNNLADTFTLSRGIIGVIILLLSFVGKDAYTAVVVLALVGAATDVLDGRTARRFISRDRKGRLGKYDLAFDTFFVLCILAYLSLSRIVMPMVLGLAWIVIALIASSVWRLKAKVLNLFEITTILALFAIAGMYDTKLFLLLIVPTTLAVVIINWDRTWHVLRVKIPGDFSE
jgi:phosphatidylglycerophosphate synthase